METYFYNGTNKDDFLNEDNWGSSVGKYIDNPEYIQVTLDSSNKIVEGIKQDGFHEFKVGIKTEKINIGDNLYYVSENQEWLRAITDDNGKIIAGIKSNGSTYIAQLEGVDINSIKQEIQEYLEKITSNIKELNDTFEYINDEENRSELKLDASSRIISYRKDDGSLVENVCIETVKIKTKDIEVSGNVKGLNIDHIDFSNYKELHIPEPYYIKVNFIGITNIPQQKGVDLKGYMEFWDMQGNYFKKEVIMNAQGRSSLSLPKKNIAIDICNNNGWNDDDTFKLQIGDWVPQDSFHLKGYMNDYLRCFCPVTYELYDEIVNTRGEYDNYVWKRALLNLNNVTETSVGNTDSEEQFNTGAKCFPKGIPCIVYLNGEFYGIYSWQLKKHRDNYQMSKSKPKHIHLDGVISNESIFNANGDSNLINWNAADSYTGLEIRNPKDLVYKESNNGSWKYNADDAVVLEIAGNSDGSTTYDSWVAGTYQVGKIVNHTIDGESHLFINTVANNSKEPAIVYNSQKDEWYNTDKDPDFKNKTKCGWINVSNTVKVKNYILELSKITNKLSDADAIYEASGKTAADVEVFKATFETYFDVANLIDYFIISDVLYNWDGFGSNWQWTTYNGTRWYINIYDVDCTFGNDAWMSNPGFYEPLSNRHISGDVPYQYIVKFYNDELEKRYADLRKAGIINAEHITDLIKNWINRLGNKETFEKEWKKWVDVREYDSIFRVNKWVNTSIKNMDSLYHYNQN